MIMEKQIHINGHNKVEFPPMHSVEYILNGSIVTMFGCSSSMNAHIEKKRSNTTVHFL